ncbi:GntR family transcriptional regulator [Chitinilyticum litopenaei]|uniref:GntR family transcriptional regulator n=1 Tax=Chitinilyticum litopenaei TaxID=1121276 RepID=UPI000419F698|nr:GntR family transcriptional regulator [Chitinilyticum litopenaei]
MTASSPAERKLLALNPDPELPQSLALQFFQKLRIAVCAGYWQPGEPLPEAQRFAELLAISTADAAMALDQLRADHWIMRDADGHDVITPKIDQPVSRLASLSDMLRARGFVPGSRWLARSVCAPDLDEQWRLNLQTGQQVARLERIRTANDIVIGYERSTLPHSLLPDPLQVGASLYEYMEAQQLHVARAVEEITAINCDAAMAARCGLPVGQPMLRLTRVSAMQSGQLIELTYSYFRSDYYHYVVELNG